MRSNGRLGETKSEAVGEPPSRADTRLLSRCCELVPFRARGAWKFGAQGTDPLETQRLIYTTAVLLLDNEELVIVI